VEIGSRARGIGLFALIVTVVFGADFAILHRGQLRSAFANQLDKAAFAALAEAEVSQLREGITLAQWMDQRGKSEGRAPSTDEADSDCRTLAKTTTLPSGRQVTRIVYFYPPQAPGPAIFPTLGGQELINHTCTLAMVRIQTQTPTWQDSRAFTQAFQRRFTKKYGVGVGMMGTHFSGGTDWMDSARWMAGFEVVSAYDPRGMAEAAYDPYAASAFVFARLPVVYKTEQDACCSSKAYRYRAIEDAQFHRAIEIAGVDADLAGRVVNLYEALLRANASPEQERQPEHAKLQDSVLPMLRDWLNALQSLEPARRAAGLYAADRLLITAGDAVSWPELRDEDRPELRSALQGIGAKFEFDELGKCYSYSGNWLVEAREMDPEGIVGQMAVLVSLARGGAPQLGNDMDQDIFHAVIADGEWLLAKNPDPPIAAQVHFMIGDAYSTIVALAGGAEPDYDDPAKYKDEADSARKKALEHYRTGLAEDGVSENAKDAWLQAWHLSAGLLPATRYVYIYD
jgi:hypothetical protein